MAILKITDIQKDLPKINQQFLELEDYKRRLREMEKQLARLVKTVFNPA